MKGLILSGGRGTRLRPLTYTSAKQLVPVANKPVLFYGIESLAAAGIREVGIVVGDTQAEIRAAVGDGSAWGIRVTYIEQDAPRGLAHAVLISEPFIGDQPFVVYLGDNLLNKGIGRFVDEFNRERPAAQILLARVPDPQMFGVAELSEGRVVRLIEKPQEPRSDLALVGVYMFSPAVFDAVRSIKPSFRNELEITDAIQTLIDRGLEVRPHIVDGWWKDTGKLEDMLEANRLILDTLERRIEGSVDASSRVEGKVVVEAGAVIEQSVVRGPVIIGARARIVHAYVGPFTSIMNDAEVREAEIEHSIVLEGSTISNLMTRVEDSLIGKNVRIYRLPVKPSAYRFMLGDNSEVGIRW
jgi:glucose-1-phosphate thymidylyltransferase